MSGRKIAIGDIHGCAGALKSLLAEVAPQADDEIVLLGDYIDRGRDSHGVVEQLLQLTEQCQVVPLLGNHEEMLLSVCRNRESLTGWLQAGGAATLDSYGFGVAPEDLPQAHLDFFRRCVPYYETERCFFVHANYDPNLPLEEQSEFTLRWESMRDRIPPRHVSGKTAIVGHTPQPDGDILDRGYLKCIDTHCYAGGWLTALDVDAGTIWQANNRGKTRER
jgi:serine/threonine protein phosphatase 1